MLVLSRKMGESVCISCACGRELTIKVQPKKRGVVRLCFSGDRDVHVHRDQCLERSAKRLKVREEVKELFAP